MGRKMKAGGLRQSGQAATAVDHLLNMLADRHPESMALAMAQRDFRTFTEQLTLLLAEATAKSAAEPAEEGTA